MSVRHDPLARAFRRACGWRLLAAAALATAALGAFLASRSALLKGLERRDDELLGGRVALEWSRPFPTTLLSRAGELGLVVAPWVRFPSAVIHGSHVALATILAAGPHYPLVGAFHLRREPGGPVSSKSAAPTPGHVWIAPALAAFLHARLGTVVDVGMAHLRVGGFLVSGPGIGWRAALFAPPLVLSQDELPATRLVLPQSRVTYGLSLGGPAVALHRYLAWIHHHVSHVRIVRRRDVFRALRRTARRLTRYVSFVVLAILALSILALGLGARALARRLAPLVAYLEAQGVSRARLRRRFLLVLLRQLSWPLGAGLVVGLLYLLAVRALFREELPLDFTPTNVARGLIVAALVVFVLALGLFMGALTMGHGTSRVAALKGSRAIQGGLWSFAALGLLLFLSGLVLVPLNTGRDLWVLVALVLASWLLPLFFRMFFALFARLAKFRAPGLWWVATALARRGWTMGIEAAALAFGLGLALTSVGVEHAFVHEIARGLRHGRPNWFVYGITARERHELAGALGRIGLGPIHFAPLVTARLTRIDGHRVHARDARYRRAAWLLRHDQNLSSAARLPPANRILRGRFWKPRTRSFEASLSQRFARLLHVGIGTRLTYLVAGHRVTLRVTSLRHVDWWSFQPNFFVLTDPHALRALPRSYLTALSVPRGDLPRFAAILRHTPGVSAVDVSELLRFVGRMLRASRTLLLLEAASLVLAVLLLAVVALEESREERRRERVRLAWWGLGPRRIARLARGEDVLLVLVAGLAGGLGAMGFTAFIVREIIRLSCPPLLWMLPASVGGAVLFLLVASLLAPRVPSRGYSALRGLDERGGSG